MAANANTPGLHDDFGPLIRRTTIAMICLSAIFLCGRLYARWLSNVQFWWDDYFAIAGLVLAWGSSFTVLEMVNAGAGTHTEVTVAKDPHILTRYLQRLFAIEVLYSTCLPVIKCSLLLFYWRIFKTRKFQIAVYAVGVFIVCWFLATLLVSIFGCIPVKAAWDPTIAGARCINSSKFFLGNGVLNLSGDFMILCMPIPMVWSLQLARPKKIALTAVFLFGTCAMASSIVRFIYLVAATRAGSDILWSQGYLGLWAAIEVNLGVVAACIPAMQSVLRQIYKFFSIDRTRPRKGSWIGRKWLWTGKVLENDAPGSNSNPTPCGFHRLGDSERLPKKTYLSSLSDTAYTGIGSSTVTNYSYRHDDGGNNKDAIPLDAIHVKKDVSISDAQQV